MNSENLEIKKLLEEYSKIINKAIEKLIPKKIDLKSLSKICGKPQYTYDLDAVQKTINDPIWDMLDRGGKRWRPVLFLLIYEALGGNKEDVLDISIIPEVAHNGSLIIDDIEDGSYLRRGKPATYKVFGNDVAINAGNIMYFLPLLSLINNKDKFDDNVIQKVYEIYIKEMINIHFGQGMDIAWHKELDNSKIVSEEEYLQMCLYKSGSLARMAAKMAATLAGKDEQTVEVLGELAGKIGVAFQIQDDILNLTGEEFMKRKGFGEDITEGKKSLLVVYTLNNANENDKKRLLNILTSHTKDKKEISDAINIINSYGSIEYAKKVAKEIIDECWGKVDKILPSSDAKNKLKMISNYLIERKI